MILYRKRPIYRWPREPLIQDSGSLAITIVPCFKFAAESYGNVENIYETRTNKTRQWACILNFTIKLKMH